jgi:hypothetical protein
VDGLAGGPGVALLDGSLGSEHSSKSSLVGHATTVTV